MSRTVSDFFWERLHQWGVRRVFGYPGDGDDGLMGALDRAGDKLEFVQVRHEEMAAFMASAHAKYTGELGVCIATSGPGASHLITGLYDAKLDHMPVLAIVGQTARMSLGGHFQQEVDLLGLYKDVAGTFVHQVDVPAQAPHLIDRAVRIAIAERRVTALIFPKDVQALEMEEPPRKSGALHSGVGYSKPRIVPYDEDLRRASEILNGGKRVAILLGAGAREAAEEVIAVADTLGAGLAKALLAKAIVPDDLPWVTGSIGMLGTKPSSRMMGGCDTLLMIGSGFPYSEFLPNPGQARGVQIDIDPGMLSLRYPMDAPLVGDARETLKALLPLLRPKADDAWRREIKGWKEDWEKTLKERAAVSANPVNPQRIFTELTPRLPEGAILSCDSGSCANWYARDVKIRRGMLASLSGGLASMGAAVPYAIAAKFAYPARPVIALVGDGAMQMNNMAELITVAKYWKQWADPRWICLVMNNEDLNQVTWEQRVQEGDPKFANAQSLPDVPYHMFAELIGLQGILVDDPEQLGSAWDRALSATRPVVLEVKCDPEVPPLPPHITLAQAKHFAKAALGGDPDGGPMLLGAAKQVLSKVLAHREKAHG